jgi:hypothetical protein
MKTVVFVGATALALLLFILLFRIDQKSWCSLRFRSHSLYLMGERFKNKSLNLKQLNNCQVRDLKWFIKGKLINHQS